MDWPARPDGHIPDKTGHPCEPWLTREAIGILESILTKTTRLFEFGSGASTVWFAERCFLVNAVEHDQGWLELVRKEIAVKNLKASVSHGSSENVYQEYLRLAETILGTTSPYDVVVVDGRCRVRSVTIAAPYVRAGGYLILDNAERPYYSEVRSILSGWELRETSNGIWRTDFYRRP